MTEIKQIPISKLVPHPENPRYIRDEKFDKLKQSLVSFPEMMEKRPLIANLKGEVLGGNMRLRAAKEIGWKTVPVIYVDWSIEKQREFIIKDNAGFGQWDYDQLANNWDEALLNDWGLDTLIASDLDVDNFFGEDVNGENKPKPHTIILSYTEEDHQRVTEALESRKGTPEQIIIELLGL
jgi:hypothetical protein